MTISAEALREVSLIQSEYDQIVELLGREPSPVELGMFGSMWSEHCGYKHSRPLLKMFPTDSPRVLQGPGENAGVVDIGNGLGVAFKIESHNHPSAIEPYQGAATGVGGIVRDIFTMGARPIALLNSLRFGPLNEERNRYLFNGVVAGIGGYGNCLGIPTVAGDIAFDSTYSENPLVNAMCVGVVRHDAIMRARASGPGNLVIAVGADTGRDGIHGATFASVEDPESSHRGVVQVGNPFLEKQLMEACLELLETDYVVAMQDMGAAGLTSSIVECASSGGVGIEIDVQRVSRREEGMNAYEVMLSESQERMLVIIRRDGLPAVEELFDRWDLHADVIGQVTDDGNVRILDGGTIVADVPASYFVDECPTYVRDGRESAEIIAQRETDVDGLPDLKVGAIADVLKTMLSSPALSSREPVVRTYDHTILGNTVVPPLDGDAAVVRVKGTNSAIAVKTDCNARYVYLDPYLGGQHVIAEAARNVSCVGATPLAFTNCLNFGNPEKADTYFQLEQAIRGMADAAQELDTPVVSGNVSLYNESRDKGILPTPVVGMVGLLEDVTQSVGQHAADGNVLLLLGTQAATLGGSQFLGQHHDMLAGAPPALDLDLELRTQLLVRSLIREQLVTAAHDVSDGGLLIALAEMVLSDGLGLEVTIDDLLKANGGRLDRTLFGEAASRILVAISPSSVDRVKRSAASAQIPCCAVATVTGTTISAAGLFEVSTAELASGWRVGLLGG